MLNATEAVKAGLAAGLTKEAIYSQLLAAGHTVKDIEDAFVSASSPEPKTVARQTLKRRNLAPVILSALIFAAALFVALAYTASKNKELPDKAVATSDEMAPVTESDEVMPMSDVPKIPPGPVVDIAIEAKRPPREELGGSPNNCKSTDAVTVLPETIEDTTYFAGDTGGAYVVDGIVTVEAGAKLVLLPCTVIKLKPQSQLRVFGVLEANGKEAEPVTFANWSEEGTWESILIGKGAKATLSMIEVRGGGTASFVSEGGSIVLDQARFIAGSGRLVSGNGALAVFNSTFESLAGVTVSGGAAKIAHSRFVFGAQLHNDGAYAVDARENWWGGERGPSYAGIRQTGAGGGMITGKADVSPWLVEDPSYVDSPRLSSETGMVIERIVSITADVRSDDVWSPENGTYLISSAVRVSLGAKLAILPGTVIRFSGNGSLLVENGTLQAIGSTDKRIVFTSYLDSLGGRPGQPFYGIQAPAPGDWDKIAIEPGSKAVLKFVDIRYGGGHEYAITHSPQMHVGGAEVVIEDSIISHGKGAALFSAGSELDVRRSSITDNAEGLLIVEKSSAVVTSSNLSNNAGASVYADESSNVNAAGNWWGDAAGPVMNDESAPRNSPTQASVKGPVVVQPWLTVSPAP